MTNINRVLCAAALSLAVLTFTAPADASSGIDDTIRKSFTVETGGTLNVDTDSGSIDVRGTSRPSVEIEVVRKVKAVSRRKVQQILDDFQIHFEQKGRDVYVRGERAKRLNFWDRIWNRLNIKYIVHVPEIYNVDLRTSGGSISVVSLAGEINIRTSGGSLDVNDITGPVTGKTSGGSIRVGLVNGDVDVNTSGGSIKIEHAGGTVNARTSGGGITVNEVRGTINAKTSGGSINAVISSQPDSDSRLSTSGGSIIVRLARDIAVDLEAGTSGGSVYTDFPVTMEGKINKRKIKSPINGGGPLLYLHTSGGSIRIKKL